MDSSTRRYFFKHRFGISKKRIVRLPGFYHVYVLNVIQAFPVSDQLDEEVLNRCNGRVWAGDGNGPTGVYFAVFELGRDAAPGFAARIGQIALPRAVKRALNQWWRIRGLMIALNLLGDGLREIFDPKKHH